MDENPTPSANPRADLAEKLKSANNILVTVSRNPSVDQLASCIGLTLLLNKQGKHAAAVFSGEVPSTLEFLQPEDTLEKNTDSLRDFIIALDKSKADKLRYKVEDQVVRIFITPYRTSISEDDLDFSQGDFNVDVVVALGVQNQDDLDEAITAHGRILHDATVATINTVSSGDLGSINWTDSSASSLCELVAGLAQALSKDLLDQQIATALLTGIVAETARFSNEKTSSSTMNVSAALMAAGANQQLVASRLDDQSGEVAIIGTLPAPDEGSGDGAIEIAHEDKPAEAENHETDQPTLPAAPDDSVFVAPAENTPPLISQTPKVMAEEPPTTGGTLSANTQPEGLEPTTDPLSLPVLEQHHLLTGQPSVPQDAQTFDIPEPSLNLPSDVPSGTAATSPSPAPTPDMPPQPTLQAATSAPPALPGLTPAPAAWTPPAPEPDPNAQTLTDIESSVGSQHLDAARDEVSRALSGTPVANPEPVQSLNAQPMAEQLNAAPIQPIPAAEIPVIEQTPPNMAFDPSKFEVANDPDNPGNNPMTAPTVNNPTAPPPVPPPIPFQFGAPTDSNPTQSA